MEGRDDIGLKMPDIETPRFTGQLIEFDVPAPKPLAAFAGDYDIWIVKQDFGIEICLFAGVKGQPAKNQIDVSLTQVAGLRWNGRSLGNRKRKPSISRRQQRNNS